jgi:hypothetical protein
VKCSGLGTLPNTSVASLINASAQSIVAPIPAIVTRLADAVFVTRLTSAMLRFFCHLQGTYSSRMASAGAL